MHVEEGWVERAHCAEADRLERWIQQRVLQRRVRSAREDWICRAAELIQGAGLHPPDRPAVELEQRPPADRAERESEQGAERRDRRHGDESDPRSRRLAGQFALRLRSPEPQRRGQHDCEQSQLDEAERDVQQRELRREDSRPRHPREVGQCDPEAGERAQAAAEAEQPEQSRADGEVEDLQVDEADEAAAHCAIRATQNGFDPSRTTSANGSPSVFGSVPTERTTVAWAGVVTAIAGRR